MIGLRSSTLLLAFAIGLVAFTCNVSAADYTIFEKLQLEGNFNILINYLEENDLVEALNSTASTVTLFAPNDAAFSMFLESQQDATTFNATLPNSLLYHALLQSMSVSQFSNDQTILSADLTHKVRINIYESASNIVTVDGNQVAQSNIECSNGYIHVINGVLLGSNDTAAQLGAKLADYSMFVAAIGNYSDFVALLGNADANVTLFAPNNDAMTQFLADPSITTALLRNDSLLYRAILAGHIITNTYYLEGLKFLSPKDLLSANEFTTVQFAAGMNNSITVNGLFALNGDAHVSNGVVYPAEQVLAPVFSDTLKLFSFLSENAYSFSILLDLLQEADLFETLDSSSNYTLFAPTDAAFNKLSASQLKTLHDHPALLKQVLLYHVAEFPVYSSMLDAQPEQFYIPSAADGQLPLRINQLPGVSPTINGAVRDSLFFDVPTCKNGVIHVIDAVLLPSFANTVKEIVAGNFTVLPDEALFVTLNAAVKAAPAVAALFSNIAENITLFAPNDDAFAGLSSEVLNALLADEFALTTLLSFHAVTGFVDYYAAALSAGGSAASLTNLAGKLLDIVIRDDGIFVANQSKVLVPDITAYNGVVHVIADVIDQSGPYLRSVLTQNFLFAKLLNFTKNQEAYEKSIGYTIIVPSDAAFNALSQDVLDELFKNVTIANMVLQSLTVTSPVSSSKLLSQNATILQTLNGDYLRIDNVNGNLFVYGSQIVTADIPTFGGGFLHVIDQFVFPVELDAFATAETVPELSTFVDLVTAAGLTALLQDVTQNLTIFAPADSAFANFAYVLNYPQLSQKIAKTHVLVNNLVTFARLAAEVGQAYQSADGTPLISSLKDGVYFITPDYTDAPNSEILSVDNFATNAVIHTVGTILMPSDLSFTEIFQFYNLTTLLELLQSHSWNIDIFTSTTIFAPSNAAFEKLTPAQLDSLNNNATFESIILYHTVPSIFQTFDFLEHPTIASARNDTLLLRPDVLAEGFSVNGVFLTTADIKSTSNGIVHVIDSVLLPNTNDTVTSLSALASELAEKLTQYGLDSAIHNVTVFAPNNDAVTKAYESDSRFSSANFATSVFQNHIVKGFYFANDLSDGQKVETLAGTTVTISRSGNVILFGDAEVVLADQLSIDGLVHVINKVVLPAPSGGGDDSSSNSGAVAAGVIVPLLIIALAVGGYYFYKKRQRNQYSVL